MSHFYPHKGECKHIILSGKLQHPTYVTCGYWVLHAQTYLSLGMPFENYESKYSPYQIQNVHLLTQDLNMIDELGTPCYKDYARHTQKGPNKTLLLCKNG